MSEPGKAVFISYASQDAEAVQGIAEALRAAGVEVWFDLSELGGGDAWNAKIRKQIKECALFVPVISAHTQARLEGYFRIEWKLAAQRTHAMADAKPFLLPVVIDATHDAAAHVPEEFHAVQWTHLAAGDALGAFCERVQRLLTLLETGTPFVRGTRSPFQVEPSDATPPPPPRRKTFLSPGRLGLVAVGLVVLATVLWRMIRPSDQPVAATESPPAVRAASAVSVPDLTGAKSVAVLPFANLSEGKDTEYFSDGISEELLNVLAKVPGLRVAARTSTFYFKGKALPVSEVAQKLGVAYVVEGSVRKAGNQVRITAQLINAADGFQLWSATFDRELKDIFALQDEIAGLIAQNLKLEMGMTSAGRGEVNHQAYQLYLEGRQAWNLRTAAGFERAERCFEQALAIDGNFARARLGRADVWSIRGMEQQEIAAYGQRDSTTRARIVAEIESVLAQVPDSAEGHASLGNILWLSWRNEAAERELRRALTLDPNYATAHLWLGRVLQTDGRIDEALVELKTAADLDPLSSRMLDNYSNGLQLAGRLVEGLAIAERAVAAQPDNTQAMVRRATALADLGRHDEAVAAARQLMLATPARVTGAAYVFARCGMKVEAELAYAKLKAVSARGVVNAYVLAAMGRWEECLAALEPAAVQADIVDYLFYWPVFDPVRADPRFGRVVAEIGLKAAYDRAQAERAAWQRAKNAKR